MDKKIIIITAIIMAAVLALTAFYFNKDIKNQRKELSSLSSELTKAEQENAALKTKYEKLAASSFKDVVGRDKSIIEQDKKDLKKLFTPAFTWQSDEEYDKARKAIIKALGKTSFTDEYFIDLKDINQGIKDEDGKYLFGLKCDFNSIDVYPVYEDGDKYSYYILVDYMNYYGNDNKHKDSLNSRNLTISVTVEDGNVIFNGYTLASDYNWSEDMKYLPGDE